MMKNKIKIIGTRLCALAFSFLLLCTAWASMAALLPVQDVKNSTASGGPSTFAYVPGVDHETKDGYWGISISNGALRIFQLKSFYPNGSFPGGFPMSMLYSDGSGSTSDWYVNFKDPTTGVSIGSAQYKGGTITSQSSTAATFKPAEGDPVFQTRSMTVAGLPVELTGTLEPVNNGKMLLVGLTIQNNSTTDVSTDIKMFMDTMMDIRNITYSDDRVPVYMTPSKNAFIARANTNRQGLSAGGGISGSRMRAPGAQYVIYVNNTPNITNADFWWVGVYGQGAGIGNFWYGYKTGVDSSGYPVLVGSEQQFNQKWADEQDTLGSLGGAGSPANYDTAAAVWYNDRLIKAGESVTVKFSVGMSRANNPPVLEKLTPDKPVMINTIKENGTAMSIQGTWYDNDSAKVDIYGVVDDGVPVMYSGGSQTNQPGFSGPQKGLPGFTHITGPEYRYFDVDYDLGSYNDAKWHIVDYYIEDPEALVSNQKSVKFILFELEPVATGYKYTGDTYSESTLLGTIRKKSLPADAKIVEVGFVYRKADAGEYPPLTLTHENTRSVVANDWDGEIGSTFTGIARALDVANNYFYASYAKVQWTDPVTGALFYSYEYSEPKAMSTFYQAAITPSPSPTGSVMNPDGEGSEGSTINGDSIPNLGGNGSSSNTEAQGVGGYNGSPFVAGAVPYTASVTMKPKETTQPTTDPTKLKDEGVDEGAEDMPATGYKQVIVIAMSVSAVVAAIALYRKNHRVKKNKK